ncbi:unnamed protein product [Prunus brigantina]
MLSKKGMYGNGSWFTRKDVLRGQFHSSFSKSYSRCNNNLILKCKYHFVIPADDEFEEQLDDPFDKDDYFFKDWTHLLHWLLHNNGIGHLMCINGINRGSAFITGRDIMHLWGLLCLYF